MKTKSSNYMQIKKAVKKLFMEFDLFDNFQCDQNNM